MSIAARLAAFALVVGAAGAAGAVVGATIGPDPADGPPTADRAEHDGGHADEAG